MWDQHAWAAYAWADHAWLGQLIEDAIKFGAIIVIPDQLRDIAIPIHARDIQMAEEIRGLRIPSIINEIEIKT